MTADMIAAASAIREAVDILTKNGNYARALAVHHPGCGSRCASCGQYSPCSMERWATAAKDQVARTAARRARDVERAAQALTAPESTPAPSQTHTDRLNPKTEGAA